MPAVDDVEAGAAAAGSKPEAAKTETKATSPEAAAAAAPTNGAGKPAESSTSEQASTAARKNRLSTMFHKIKDRLSDKK